MGRVRCFLLSLTLVSTLVLCCASCSHTGPPMDVSSYLEVKMEYIKALEEAGNWLGNYRLLVIPPMVEPYMPGTPIIKGSYEPLTDSCLLPNLSRRDVVEPPVSASKQTFSFNLGIPSIIAEAMKEVAEVSASVKRNHEAKFSYSELSQLNARRDELIEAILNGNVSLASLHEFIEISYS